MRKLVTRTLLNRLAYTLLFLFLLNVFVGPFFPNNVVHQQYQRWRLERILDVPIPPFVDSITIERYKNGSVGITARYDVYFIKGTLNDEVDEFELDSFLSDLGAVLYKDVTTDPPEWAQGGMTLGFLDRNEEELSWWPKEIVLEHYYFVWYGEIWERDVWGREVFYGTKRMFIQSEPESDTIYINIETSLLSAGPPPKK